MKREEKRKRMRDGEKRSREKEGSRTGTGWRTKERRQAIDARRQLTGQIP